MAGGPESPASGGFVDPPGGFGLFGGFVLPVPVAVGAGVGEPVPVGAAGLDPPLALVGEGSSADEQATTRGMRTAGTARRALRRMV
jgi:hypothetical protein